MWSLFSSLHPVPLRKGNPQSFLSQRRKKPCEHLTGKYCGGGQEGARDWGWGGGERKGREEVDRMALQRAPPGTPASLHCMSHVDWKKKIVQHKCGEGCFIRRTKLRATARNTASPVTLRYRSQEVMGGTGIWRRLETKSR